MIKINNLTFAYKNGQPAVLKNINLLVGEGEYVGIIGPNGCGKTTLVRHFNALLTPSRGEVLIDGLDTRHARNLREIRRRVGMVFQNPDNQIVGMTVEEDIAFGPGNLGLPPAEVRRRVDQAMAMVGLQEMQTCSPYTLSGGQKQLLALAGLLAMEPKIIVLDEPVASLDPVSKEKVLSLLQDLKSRGISIIHITHSMDEIADSDRVLVMDQGQIAADAGAGEIFGRVEWLKSLGLAPPRLTELMWRLARQGEAVSANIFTVEKAFREISALLARERNSAQNQALRKAGGYV